MDIGVLRIVNAVAEQGSVTAAAKALNCVQSNVTTRIRQLEEELDRPLFYRRKRGMVLTPHGRILNDYALRAIRLIAEAEKAVKNLDGRQSSLHIGTLDSTAAARLPTILSTFHKRFPDVSLTLQTGDSSVLTDLVLDYKLDGAFIGGVVDNADIIQETMFEEELIIASEKSMHSLDGLECPTLVVFPPGCTYRAILRENLRKRGIIVHRIMEMGTLEGILGCVAAGLGITLFHRSVVENYDHADRIRMHAIDPASNSMPIRFIRRKDALTTNTLEAFLDVVRNRNE